MESGYRTTGIILMNSYFKREDVIDLNFEKLNSNIDVNVEVNTDNEKKNIYVKETLDYKATEGGRDQIVSTITMLGIFEIVGTPALSPEDFGRVNGAAIIYPFIREHLASMSLKSGLPPIFLAPLNFTQGLKKS